MMKVKQSRHDKHSTDSVYLIIKNHFPNAGSKVMHKWLTEGKEPSCSSLKAQKNLNEMIRNLFKMHGLETVDIDDYEYAFEGKLRNDSAKVRPMNILFPFINFRVF